METTLKKKKVYAGSLILKILVVAAAVFTIAMLGYLIVYILVRGIPNLSPETVLPALYIG